MNTTSVGSFLRLSAMRTRKLACDRQKEKNFMGHSTFLPLSPCGRGWLASSDARRVRGLSPRIETPHPILALRGSPSPTRGEGKEAVQTGYIGNTIDRRHR